jgi:hypothetical protein
MVQVHPVAELTGNESCTTVGDAWRIDTQVPTQPHFAKAMTSSSLALPIDSGRRLLPWLVAVAFFMESLDTTILSTAAPAVAQALGVPPLSMKAVLASYTLSLAVFMRGDWRPPPP